MIYYLIPILIGIIFSFYSVKLGPLNSKSSRVRNFYLLLTAFIFCGGYMTGSDWVNYEIMYLNISISDISSLQREKGFFVLMLIFKQLGFGFFPFLILVKFIVFYIVANFILKHFESFYLPFSIFLSTYALFLYVDNPLRFMIAFGIIVLSFKYLLERKFIPYALIIIFATTFHISSVIMLVIYFSLYIKVSRRFLLIIYFFIFFTLSPHIVGNLIQSFFPQLPPLISTYFHRMQIMEYNAFPIGKVINAIFFIVIVFNKSLIERGINKGNVFFILSINFFFFNLLGYIIPTFFRFSIFLSIFFDISLAFLTISITRKAFLRVFLCSYLLFTTVRSIYSTYVYIPYSNYFISLFQNEKEYYERSRYNKIKYYERTGSWPEYFGEEV